MLITTWKVDYAALTDRGLVRSDNEDAWSISKELGLFLVADGMGGRAGGEVAARCAVESIPVRLAAVTPSLEALRKTIVDVNSEIYRMSQRRPELAGMGTTLCSLLIQKEEALIAHVGDSRIYRLRNQQLQQLTVDHSLLSELLALGGLTAEESTSFPYKHILTKALGTQSTVVPECQVFPLVDGDLFLLCTDGLTNSVTDSELSAILAQNISLTERGEALIALANERGGIDNTTVLLVHIER